MILCVLNCCLALNGRKEGVSCRKRNGNGEVDTEMMENGGCDAAGNLRWDKLTLV